MFAILSNICSPIDLSLGDFLLLYELLEFIEFLTVFKLLVVPISIFFIMFMRFYYFFSPNRLAFFVSYRLSREERPGICGNLALLLRVNIYSFLISNLMCWNPSWVDCIEVKVVSLAKRGDCALGGYFLSLLLKTLESL